MFAWHFRFHRKLRFEINVESKGWAFTKYWVFHRVNGHLPACTNVFGFYFVNCTFSLTHTHMHRHKHSCTHTDRSREI